MFRFLLVLIILTESISFCQSKYGFTTGIDDEALKFNVRKKTMLEIKCDSTICDTMRFTAIEYNELGYIMSYNPNNNGKYIFEYNEMGYLIDEKQDGDRRGPIGVNGPDTSYTKQITFSEQFDDTDRIKEETMIYYWHEGDSSKYFDEYFYDEKNRIDSIVHYYNGKQETIEKFIYRADGLLLERVYFVNKAVRFRYIYIYEFY